MALEGVAGRFASLDNRVGDLRRRKRSIDRHRSPEVTAIRFSALAALSSIALAAGAQALDLAETS